MFLRFLFGFAFVDSELHRALGLSGIQQPSVEWLRRGSLFCSCSYDPHSRAVTFMVREHGYCK
jgi:hypothetical protein